MDRKQLRRRLAGGLVTVAVLVASLGVGVAPVAASNGEVAMGIFVRPTETAYGEILTLEATTRDDSDSCFGTQTPGSSCDFPHGRIDFYAVTGATQIFLTSADLGLDLDVPIDFWQTSTDDVEFCCLEIGSYDHIRAYYVPGDFDANSIDSGPISVDRNGSTSTLQASATTTTVGQSITFNVHTAGYSSHPNAAKATGFVDVYEGATSYGTAQLDANGNASITTSQLPAGTHFMRARWGGDGHYEASFSAPLEILVNGGAANSSLSASSTSTTYGSPVTFTATVSPVAPALAIPTGAVTFNDGGVSGTQIGTGFLNGASPNVATFTTSELSVGSHLIQAFYGGDPNFFSSTSNSVTVNVTKAATTTSLQSSANPSDFGEAVTLTATVDGPGTTTVPGTVQFKAGAVNLGVPQALVLGQASLTIGSLPGGSSSITAVYSGSASYLPSTSAALVQTVACDKLVTGTTGSVTAVSGGSTCISGAKITGNISVPDGSSLSIVNSTVSGSVTITAPETSSASLVAASNAAGAGAVTVCGSSIGGSVRISGVGGFVLIGDLLEDACAGNTIKGSVTITGTRGGLALAGNRISGGVTVANNTGTGPAGHAGPEVEANTIGGFLSAYGNSPVVTDDGRPNTVKGWAVFG